MFRHVLSVGGLTLASRVLGFVRDVLTAALIGAGPVADAFFVALRLPNHFRALFAEGAFNAAFVPLFSETLVKEGREAARRFAEQVKAVLLSVQLVLLVVFLVVMPGFMLIFAPGFAGDPYKFDLAVLFTRITFPYLLFISLETLLGAMLNSLGRFAAAAAAPILLNLFLIAALVWATPLLPTAGHALAWGVLAAGIAQYLYLVYDSRRAGMPLRFRWPRFTQPVVRFLRLLGPAALGAGLVQINLFVDTIIASFLPTGAVSYLYYADRLNQLPLGVIGIAVGTVLLPRLSQDLKRGDDAAAAHGQNRALEFSLLLTLPAAAAFATIAEPMIAALFQRGAFSAADAAASAHALIAYAVGLPAFVAIRSLVPGFHARQDTATPVRIALVSISVNIVLKLLLITPLSFVGLALATSASAWVNAGLLAWVLHRRDHLRTDARLRRNLPRIALATVVMAGVLLAGRWLGAPWLNAPSLLVRDGALAGLMTLGLGSYFVLAWSTGLLNGFREPERPPAMPGSSS